MDEVKERFAALLKDVGATEIAQLEQMLISEGLPEEEVKRLAMSMSRSSKTHWNWSQLRRAPPGTQSTLCVWKTKPWLK